MMTRPRRGKRFINHDAHPLIPARLSGHIANGRRGGDHGRQGEVYFPNSRHRHSSSLSSAAVVTFANIGFRADFVQRWLSAFFIGWPVASR